MLWARGDAEQDDDRCIELIVIYYVMQVIRDLLNLAVGGFISVVLVVLD